MYPPGEPSQQACWSRSEATRGPTGAGGCVVGGRTVRRSRRYGPSPNVFVALLMASIGFVAGFGIHTNDAGAPADLLLRCFSPAPCRRFLRRSSRRSGLPRWRRRPSSPGSGRVRLVCLDAGVLHAGSSAGFRRPSARAGGRCGSTCLDAWLSDCSPAAASSRFAWRYRARVWAPAVRRCRRVT